MRKAIYNLAFMAAVLTMFVSCQQEQIKPNLPSAISHADIADAVGKQSSANNSMGAFFIMPTSSQPFRDTVSFILGNGNTGEVAIFTGGLGKGDFYRQNPNGTVSFKLSDHNASAYYSDSSGNQYTGGGNMHMSYTGTVDTIILPFPGVPPIILLVPGAKAAVNWQGNAMVDDGMGGPNHHLLASLTKAANQAINQRGKIQLK